MSWRDLLVVVKQSPADSALNRARYPESWEWGLAEHLAAVRVNQAAGKRVIVPPSGEDESDEGDVVRHGGGTVVSIEEMQARLVARDQRQRGHREQRAGG